MCTAGENVSVGVGAHGIDIGHEMELQTRMLPCLCSSLWRLVGLYSNVNAALLVDIIVIVLLGLLLECAARVVFCARPLQLALRNLQRRGKVFVQLTV
jgi:hypothetical protein